MKFALNRLDLRTPAAFATSANAAEEAGWDMGLIPCNPLAVHDPYVCLALATEQTTTMALGTLLDNPVVRHPAVLAGSIATVASLAPGRIHCGLGIGDTAVRFNGLAPATTRSFEKTLREVSLLLAGHELDVGAMKPAKLRHHTTVPVWVAAQGPKMLRLAGELADGVFLRVGTHPGNLRRAWQAVCEGAEAVGRDPNDIELALIFHTVVCDDPAMAKLMAKSMAAGYYEYTPFLFDAPGFTWDGPDVHELKKAAYPDFHHHNDPVASGKLVEFLDDSVADAFALYGDWDTIAAQLKQVLALDLPVSMVLPHPVLPKHSTLDYLHSAARHLLPRFRDL